MLFLQTTTYQDSGDMVSDTFYMPGILATSLPLHWEREEEAFLVPGSSLSLSDVPFVFADFNFHL